MVRGSNPAGGGVYESTQTGPKTHPAFVQWVMGHIPGDKAAGA